MFKDEEELLRETEADLRARIMTSQFLARVLLQGYAALKSYGVDFMSLREWKENAILDNAWRLKPQAAQERIFQYLARVEHAIKAAVNRKTNIKKVVDNSDTFPE